jgi:hypothetical protein
VIVYDLGCENSHRFEGWFASSEDFQRQQTSRLLSCPLCGNEKIARLPHASYVNVNTTPAEKRATTQDDAHQYANLAMETLARLVETIIEKTEDVGAAFPEEARKIHYKESPERHIRGTASAQDVESLRDEGIEVIALPALHRPGKTH